jgi:hypothetical protein
MPSLRDRFKVLEDEAAAALETLRSVLEHVANTNPAAPLRVIILNNVIVSLVSSVEESLRELFQEYLSILQESFEDHRSLRTELQRANLECGIRELQRARSAVDFRQAAIVAKALFVCLEGQSGYQLFKEQLTHNDGNFKSQQLTEIAKQMGVPQIWKLICDCVELETTTAESVLDTRINKVIGDWNAIFEERDLVVHNISKASGWSSDRIGETMAFFQLILSRVAVCLADDAQSQIDERMLRQAHA